MSRKKHRGSGSAAPSGPVAPESSPTAALGLAIRSRRRALGLTQAALARFAGCGLAFLYELEAGKPTVRMDKVLAVLEVLGLTLKLEPGRKPLTIDLSDAEKP